jgi:hypothetical protein
MAGASFIDTGVKKANSLPDDVPIYYYGGHGRDLCKPGTDELMIDTVPEDCIYVTVGECGFETAYENIVDIVELFRDSSKESRTILRYPYLFKSLKELSIVSKTKMKNIHVHLPGSKYVVSQLFPPLYFNSDRVFGMIFSGLSEKSLLEKVPSSVESFLNIKDFFTYKYRGKLKPIEETARLISRLKEVFAEYPEIQNLLKKDGASILLHRMFPYNRELSEDSILEYLSELYCSIDTDTFLDFFKGSVFPTEEQVRTLISKYTMGMITGELYPMDILMIDSAIQIDFKKKESDRPFTSKSLMEKYPGIHYNMVCRVVSEKCEKKATLQRTSSNLAEKKRREEMYAKKDFTKFNGDYVMLSESYNDIPKIVDFIIEHKEYLRNLPVNKLKIIIRNIVYEHISQPLVKEKGDTIYKLIIEELFLFKESYTVEELIDDESKIELLNDLFYLLHAKGNFTDVRNKLLSNYLDRVNISSISELPESKHKNLRTLHLMTSLALSPKHREIFNKLIDLLKSNNSRPRSHVVVAEPAKNNSEYENNLGYNNGYYDDEVDDYSIFLDGLYPFIDKEYPKAKDEKNIHHTRQVAIYNYLISKKRSLNILSVEDREKLIKFLTDEKIIVEGPREPPISKKIKKLILPSKYSNSKGGGTRKKGSSKKRYTRKV